MASKVRDKDMTRRGGDKGIRRRDFLKYSALAGAAGAAVLHLGGALHPSDALLVAEAASKSGDLGNNRNWDFQVVIDGLPETSANIVSIQVEDLTIDARDTTTGADWDYRTYAPGDAHYGKVTLRARIGKDSKELQSWVDDASVGKNVRKNISVILNKRDGSEARRYYFMECFPVKWDPGDYSPSSTTRVETIVVKIGHVEFA
ncbi:MAG: phage tail protein [Chloroflexi bacterium]|nr:phage tail protein [Chloroflexota bacterium]